MPSLAISSGAIQTASHELRMLLIYSTAPQCSATEAKESNVAYVVWAQCVGNMLGAWVHIHRCTGTTSFTALYFHAAVIQAW